MSYSAKFASCFYGPFRWVCPSARSVPSRRQAGRELRSRRVIWEGGSARAWAAAGTTLVALERAPPPSRCERETNVPFPGEAGRWEDHLGDLLSHPLACSSWVLVARQAGRELPGAVRGEAQELVLPQRGASGTSLSSVSCQTSSQERPDPDGAALRNLPWKRAKGKCLRRFYPRRWVWGGQRVLKHSSQDQPGPAGPPRAILGR